MRPGKFDTSSGRSTRPVSSSEMPPRRASAAPERRARASRHPAPVALEIVLQAAASRRRAGGHGQAAMHHQVPTGRQLSDDDGCRPRRSCRAPSWHGIRRPSLPITASTRLGATPLGGPGNEYARGPTPRLPASSSSPCAALAALAAAIEQRRADASFKQSAASRMHCSSSLSVSPSLESHGGGFF